MSEWHKRQEKGIDYWIKRCDEAENIIEEFESNTQRLLNCIVQEKDIFKLKDYNQLKLGISKLILLDNIDASHLNITPFKR